LISEVFVFAMDRYSNVAMCSAIKIAGMQIYSVMDVIAVFRYRQTIITSFADIFDFDGTIVIDNTRNTVE